MGRTKAQLEAGELAQCNRFLAWWRAQSGEVLRIIERPNPPDFVLESDLRRTWLEVSDVFFDDEDVDWRLSSDSSPREILGDTDDQFIARFVRGLHKKLSKRSYSSAHSMYGRGILLLTAQYALMDGPLLDSLQLALRTILTESDHGFFGEAYLECQLTGRWQYGLVYPRVELVEEAL
jgi:hypothetical protein